MAKVEMFKSKSEMKRHEMSEPSKVFKKEKKSGEKDKVKKGKK